MLLQELRSQMADAGIVVDDDHPGAGFIAGENVKLGRCVEGLLHGGHHHASWRRRCVGVVTKLKPGGSEVDRHPLPPG